MGTVTWLSYNFEVCQKNSSWHDVGGVYIFCGLNRQNRWFPVYIGKTESFSDRIPSHGQWDTAQSLGATHVHALVVHMEEDRSQIEEQLIRAYQPPLNQQLKMTGSY